VEEGLKQAEEQNKPMMLFVKRPKCDGCKQLFGELTHCGLIDRYSDHFVMVRCNAKDVPKERKYAPDGRYVPRFLFYHPDGDLMADVINERRSDDEFKYAYEDVRRVTESMERAKGVYVRQKTIQRRHSAGRRW